MVAGELKGSPPAQLRASSALVLLPRQTPDQRSGHRPSVPAKCCRNRHACIEHVPLDACVCLLTTRACAAAMWQVTSMEAGSTISDSAALSVVHVGHPQSMCWHCVHMAMSTRSFCTSTKAQSSLRKIHEPIIHGERTSLDRLPHGRNESLAHEKPHMGVHGPWTVLLAPRQFRMKEWHTRRLDWRLQSGRTRPSAGQSTSVVLCSKPDTTNYPHA